MVSPEKRLSERSDVFLIVEFRPIRHAYEYSLGVTNNCSCEGFNFESHYHGLKRGDILEFNLKHPLIDLSVPAVGEVVWKKEVWYARVTGVKLRNMDPEAHERISELISSDHDIPFFPSIPDEKSEADHNDSRTVKPVEYGAQKDNAIFDRLQQYNEILPKNAGESVTRPVVSDNQRQCAPSVQTVHTSAALDYTGAANMPCQQKSYLSKRAFRNGSPFRDMCKAVIASILVSLRNSDDRSWLPVPLALLLAGIATIALSMEFDLKRIELKSPAALLNTTEGESRASLSDDWDDETYITSEQEVHIPATPEIAVAMCSESPGSISAASVQQSPDPGDTSDNKNYFVQVGAWKNLDYAQIMLAQLQKEYPATYVMPKNEFQIIMIPGLESETQGLRVSKAIKSKFHLDPLLILRKEHSPSPAPRRTVSQQQKRKIQPKSAFKIKDPVEIENMVKAREVLISQKSSGNREIDLKEPPEPVLSSLRNEFLIRTMHRNPALIE